MFHEGRLKVHSEDNNTPAPAESKVSSIAERYLEIALGSEKYALPLPRVREVIAPPKVTEVPGTPAYYVGMMNLRGQVLSVIDLRKRLNITPKQEGQEAVVILEFDDVSIGAFVDSVNKVLSFSGSEVSAPPPNLNKTSAHVVGIYQSEENLVSILALEKLLDLPKIASHAA
ncbi:MAG TPA: hypothetical protein DCL41_05535 [Bdellovibrionales bacterium]|nr:hypothetical protein [Bdellovibrionales bacterium]